MTVSIDIVFKIAAIGILIAVLNQLLSRAGKDDIALMTSIAGLVIVLLMVVDLISNLFDSVKSIFGLY
ncbi:MAG: stage III sporulation protein AC [Lachnospiraceae bacterium]